MAALQDQYTGATCLGHATFLQIIFFSPSWIRAEAEKPRILLVFGQYQANALGYLFKQGNLNFVAISTS